MGLCCNTVKKYTPVYIFLKLTNYFFICQHLKVVSPPSPRRDNWDSPSCPNEDKGSRRNNGNLKIKKIRKEFLNLKG